MREIRQTELTEGVLAAWAEPGASPYLLRET